MAQRLYDLLVLLLANHRHGIAHRFLQRLQLLPEAVQLLEDLRGQQLGALERDALVQ